MAGSQERGRHLIKLFGIATLLLLAAQNPGDPCATGETPCDPNKPWMRGRIEKSCAPTGQLARLRREHPGRQILECHCQHTCDPLGDDAAETNNRGWDAACQARCSPSNCVCEHPCGS